MTPSAYLAALYGLAILWGVRNTYYWVPSILDLLIPIAIFSILIRWAMADARRRGDPLPLTAPGSMFFIAPLAVPGYLICTRGWRGLGWALANLLGLMAISTIAMHAGGLLWFGRQWLVSIGLAR